MHLLARRATAALASRGDEPVIASQSLIEAWNVATRPLDGNGFGWTPDLALEFLRSLERSFDLLEDPPDLYHRWLGIVERFAVSGVQVHDARLVALMIACNVEGILTFNGQDFRRYAPLGLTVLDPKTLGSE